MVDEMDEYRDRIERRQSERRQLKNDRRQDLPEPIKRSLWEPAFAIDMLILFGMLFALFYFGK